MHNLCAHFNPSAVCMTDSFYSKQFPKYFVNETGHDEALYVTYRRRSPDSGGQSAPWAYRTLAVASIAGTVDDVWVVCYCSKQSIMFQCHLNIELSGFRTGGIKYLFKYV